VELARQVERVAVRRRLRRRLAGDVAAGAAAVLDHDLLAPGLRQVPGHDARDGIGAAAGRIGHDQAHVARRPGLRPCAADKGKRGDAGDGCGDELPARDHRSLPGTCGATTCGGTVDDHRVLVERARARSPASRAHVACAPDRYRIGSNVKRFTSAYLRAC
jgi:hypothetical protein